MAKHVLTDASVVINSVDLSDHVESVEISYEYEDVDLTAMGATAREHAKGLRNDAVTVNFFQDFAASEVDQTLSALLTNTTGFPVVIKPTSAAVSTTNPSYSMTSLLFTYQPLNATVGEANQTSVEFLPSAGSAIVRATS